MKTARLTLSATLLLAALTGCAVHRPPVTSYAPGASPTAPDSRAAIGVPPQSGSRPAAAERYADRPGERRSRGSATMDHPRWTAMLTAGPGNFGQETFGTPPNLDDDTRSLYFQGRVEHVSGFVGGGVQLSAVATDDDLHRNESLPASGGGSDARARVFEIYPHLTLRPRGGRFRMPMRVGPSFQWIGVEFDNGDDVDYGTLSLLFEIEPEVDLVRNDEFRLSAYGAFRAGFGGSAISVEGVGIDETFDTDQTQSGLDIGMRFQFDRVFFGFSYLRRNWDFDASDVENGLFVEESDFDFEGVMFTFGGRW